MLSGPGESASDESAACLLPAFLIVDRGTYIGIVLRIVQYTLRADGVMYKSQVLNNCLKICTNTSTVMAVWRGLCDLLTITCGIGVLTYLDILKVACCADELINSLLQGAVQLWGGAAPGTHIKEAAVRQRGHTPRGQPGTHKTLRQDRNALW